MRTILAALTAAVLLTLAACDAWPEQRRSNALQVVAEMESEGTVTPEQAAGLRQAIDELAKGTTLEDVLSLVAEVGGSIVAALFGVRLVRGPAKPVPKGDAPLLAQVLERERKRAGGAPDAG